MIPSTNNKLLVSEDWKKIYQSYRNADFQSYDFETLRRTMIQYLQENFPEDFNDFIDSSEYIALIDLIAYLGQNLSFRIDLNARENFLETAQRRDSILRLAQLISYVPKRNTPASGFLKVSAISTTDNVIDGNGINLANTTVGWNDPTNSNWYSQFISIMNSSMAGSYAFGKPYDRQNIDGVLTEQYKINSTNTDIPVYSFSKNINGTPMTFEIVSSAFSGKTSIYEESPLPANTLGLIYKNDNQGQGSINTGFFAHFRQGSLSMASFSVDTPVPNEIIGVNTTDINNSDVWLWQLDANNAYSTLWTKVSDVVGNNVIYNSLNNDVRNIYSVTSRDNDQIDLNFADGSFGNLPKGNFKLFYRQSNGLTYSIKPEQMSGIVIDVPYYNKNGQQHTLTLTLTLQYTVNNSSGPESNASIQNKAPQAYYVQNRMVTAEDYNIAPLTLGNDILKVKSINRVSSGLSKYFDLSDVSGKYSKTNIFATDGIVYKDTKENSFEFEFTSRNEIAAVIKQQLASVLASTEIRSFYLDQYSRPPLPAATWATPVEKNPRGYFTGTGGDIPVASFNSNNFKYVSPGALVKFVPPTGYKFFTANGKKTNTESTTTRKYIWAKVIQVIGSGAGKLTDGTGPVILSEIIDQGSIPTEVIPKFVNVFSSAFETELFNLCLGQRNFGLSLDKLSRTWAIVSDVNLDTISPFSLANQNDKSNSSKDASWIIAFTWTGKKYKVRYRNTDYIFESDKETSFFIEADTINYDFTNDTVVKDQVTVLSINHSSTSTYVGLGKDYTWQIDSAVVEVDGYVEPKKVKVSFYDYNNTGQITDPDAFTNIVGTGTSFVYFQRLSDGLRYTLTDGIEAHPTPDDVGNKIDNQLYYFYNQNYNVVNSYSTATSSWIYEPNYFAYPGRSNLKFHYVHNSGEDRRIDPSKSNLIDVYLLTSAYDTAYRTWLTTGVGSAPLAPTSQSLEENFSSSLETIKTVSDEIIFQPVKYKVLFGSQSDSNLQATFKAVKNPTRPVSDNELKTRILSAINEFFSLSNWDFGQTFYFSELSTYVMNLLSPDITNFVIIPKSNNNFGSLYEVACLSNEIFISGATVFDIEIIDAITSSQLNTPLITTGTGS
jgi:hypothetical protein